MILDFGYVCMEILSEIHDGIASNIDIESAQHSARIGGKAATTAIASARMGARTSVIACTGSDIFADFALHILKREGINIAGITKADEPSGLIQSIIGFDGQKTSILNAGANRQTCAAQVPDRFLDIKTLVLVQDNLPESENLELLSRARRRGARSMMLSNSAPKTQEILEYLDYLVLPYPVADTLPCALLTPKIASQNPLCTEIFAGTFAACLQANIPIHVAQEYADTASSLVSDDLFAKDPFPYLGDIESALKMTA